MMDSGHNPSSEGESSSRTYNGRRSDDHTPEPSNSHSRPGSPGDGSNKPRERGRVRFNNRDEVNNETHIRFTFPLQGRTLPSPILQAPKQTLISPAHSRNNSIATVLRHKPEQDGENPVRGSVDSGVASPIRRLNNPFLRNNSVNSITSLAATLEDEVEDNVENPTGKASSALAAQKRAQRVATHVESHPTPSSPRASFDEDEETEDDNREPRNRRGLPVRIDDIPLVELGKRAYDGPDSETEDEQPEPQSRRVKTSSNSEAHKLVRSYTRPDSSDGLLVHNAQSSGLVSGQLTPIEEQDADDYVARPEHFRGGILSSILRLYNAPGASGSARRLNSRGSTASPSETPTPGTSGTTTPSKKVNKWYKQDHHSRDTLAGLLEATARLSASYTGEGRHETLPRSRGNFAGGAKRSRTSRLKDSAKSKFARPRLEDEIRLTVHIAETLSRQKYIIRLCKVLMSYGAPTHRLEEYMKMTARVLEIEGQFLYIPGCMLISFDDPSSHTTEVKLVRTTQGVNLGKLQDAHEVYKDVMHDCIGVEEATQRLDVIIRQRATFNKWFLVLVYGFASATVGPFAFQARLIDLPISFLLGSTLGILQLVIAPKSDLYANVFEVSAAVLTSFLARAFGSITYGRQGERLFCFSALAESSISLILPGYMILSASLELQSKSIVAGSVRMVYAIIYSLFIGFGMTIGTAMYGLLDSNASSATGCTSPMNRYYGFMFAPFFALCLCIINHAKWKQLPMMLSIAIAGYLVNFFSVLKFPRNPQISNTVGALAVGLLGNFYSRLWHGVAAAALIPAILLQVPSGMVAGGSLVMGLQTADNLNSQTGYANGTAKSSEGAAGIDVFDPIVLNVGFAMLQIAIGISVGLFLSAIIVYPFGKRRSGLFSF